MPAEEDLEYEQCSKLSIPSLETTVSSQNSAADAKKSYGKQGELESVDYRIQHTPESGKALTKEYRKDGMDSLQNSTCATHTESVDYRIQHA